MIARDQYLNKLIENRDNGRAKVVTGIRRDGKTTLLREIYKPYLLSQGVDRSDVVEVDFNMTEFAAYRDPLVFSNYLHRQIEGKAHCYVFVDEIQKIFPLVNPSLTGGKHVVAKEGDLETLSFSDVVLDMAVRTNVDFYCTGSNSKMLSSDIESSLRGKQASVHLYPLSYGEMVKAYPAFTIDEYLRYGGMPECFLSKGDRREYLRELFDTTYFNDIIERYQIRKPSLLNYLADILATSVGFNLSLGKICKTMESRLKEKVNAMTLLSYLNYFKDAFLVDEVRRFDLKGRREIGGAKRFYFTDLGLRNARLNFAFDDYGPLLENAVYIELRNHGYTVNCGVYDFYGKADNDKTVRETGEVDFYATKGDSQLEIQVCDNLEASSTREREFRPFRFLHDQAEKIIVTRNDEGERRSKEGYRIIGARAFFLDYLSK